MWKYVDDTTMAEIVPKNQSSNIQWHVDYFAEQVSLEKFQLNEDKCKELRITVTRSNKNFNPITVNDKNFDCVTQMKILGVNLSSDLKWNNHVSEVIKKVNKRLYFLRQLKHSQVKPKELRFYSTSLAFDL